MTEALSKILHQPWEASPSGEANFWRMMTADNWLMSVQLNGELSELQQAEIVRLMKAAPRLLAALESAVAYLDDSSNNLWGNVMTQARKAIADAKEG